MTPKDEALRLEGVQYTTGEYQRAITNSSRKNEVVGPSGNNAQFICIICSFYAQWICLVVKVKSDMVKNNTAQEHGKLGP